MGRRRATSILITEIYEGSTRRINVMDEVGGEIRSATMPMPCSNEQADEIKRRLIAEVKGETDESDRHSTASVPDSTPALSDTALAPQPA